MISAAESLASLLTRDQRAATPEPVVEPDAPVTQQADELPIRNGTTSDPHSTPNAPTPKDSIDMQARLDAAEKEREALRTEVTELRKSLEQVQGKQQEELLETQRERDAAQAAKEKADSQYQTLLGRVNTIRSQLGERLKADAV